MKHIRTPRQCGFGTYFRSSRDGGSRQTALLLLQQRGVEIFNARQKKRRSQCGFAVRIDSVGLVVHMQNDLHGTIFTLEKHLIALAAAQRVDMVVCTANGSGH